MIKNSVTEQRVLSKRIEPFAKTRENLLNILNGYKKDILRLEIRIKEKEGEIQELKNTIDAICNNWGFVNYDHLEHEFNLYNCSFEEIKKILEKHISYEMKSSISNRLIIYFLQKEYLFKLKSLYDQKKLSLPQIKKKIIQEYYSPFNETNLFLSRSEMTIEHYKYLDEVISLSEYFNDTQPRLILFHAINYPDRNIINARYDIGEVSNYFEDTWEQRFDSTLNFNIEISASSFKYDTISENFIGSTYGFIGFVYDESVKIYHCDPKDIKSQVHYDPKFGEYKRRLKYHCVGNTYNQSLKDRINKTLSPKSKEEEHLHDEWIVSGKPKGILMNFDFNNVNSLIIEHNQIKKDCILTLQIQEILYNKLMYAIKIVNKGWQN